MMCGRGLLVYCSLLVTCDLCELYLLTFRSQYYIVPYPYSMTEIERYVGRPTSKMRMQANNGTCNSTS